MTIMRSRIVSRGRLDRSMESMRIVPVSISRRRSREARRELFPLPVRPQMLTRAPGGRDREILRRATLSGLFDGVSFRPHLVCRGRLTYVIL
jgi:hypothetical protein